MKANMSRRSLLAGAGCAAAGTAVGQILSVVRAQEAAQAQQGQAGGICLSMIFEDGAKVKFDSAKYRTNVLPLLRDAYGDSVERIELRTVVDAENKTRLLIATMGGKFAMRASCTFWIKDVQAFGQRLVANADRITKAVDAVAKGNRLVQTERIALALGDARGEVPAGNELMSIYFLPYTDVVGAPAFDQRYFVDSFVPRLYSELGSKAVRRVEASVGLEQGGRKPAQIAGFQIFIRDLDAYALVSSRVSRDALKGEFAMLTQNTMLLSTSMTVAGVI